MKNNLKHFADTFCVALLYIGMIVFPVSVILIILGPFDLGNGLTNLFAIIFAVIMAFVCTVAARESRYYHNQGKRFLFD